MLILLLVFGFSLLLCYYSKVFLILPLIYILFHYKLFELILIKIKDLLTFYKEVRGGTYFKRIYGVYGVVGEYGQGKTIEMSRLYLSLSSAGKFYDPNDYVFISNYGLGDTLPFKDLTDVINYYRDAVSEGKGLVVFWDEIQNEFPENDRGFPLAFRVLLTQNRKNKGVRVIWSTQDYTRVNKNLRLMTTQITEMSCKLGRYMCCRHYKRAVYEDMYNTTDILRKVKKRPVFTSYYIQTDKLRNLFDSFKMLDIAKKNLGL